MKDRSATPVAARGGSKGSDDPVFGEPLDRRYRVCQRSPTSPYLLYGSWSDCLTSRSNGVRNLMHTPARLLQRFGCEKAPQKSHRPSVSSR